MQRKMMSSGFEELQLSKVPLLCLFPDFVFGVVVIKNSGRA